MPHISYKDQLSPRQKEILYALCENGATDAELAQRFGVKVITIRQHISNIFDKTGYGSRCELVVNTLHKRYQKLLKSRSPV